MNVSTSSTQNFITGLVTAFADVMVTHPLWTMKSLQQQRYTNRQILQKFARNPVLAYNGLLPHAIAMMPITTLRVYLSSQFDVYFSTKKQYLSEETAAILSSYIAGSLCSSISGPTELVRTIKLKQAALSKKAESPSFNQIAGELIKKKGIRSLTNGMLIISIRDGSYTAAFFALAPITKERLSPYITNNIVNTLVSYTIASTTVTFLNHPCDTIKNAQHLLTATSLLTNAKINSGIISACSNIFGKDGFTGFWIGFPARGARFLLGLVVKASTIEYMNNFWIKKNV